MTTSRPLYLHEELLLLALRNEEGTLLAGSPTLGLGGAVLAELLLRGRVRVDPDRPKAHVELVDRRPVGEPVLDEALQQIANARRPRLASAWVAKFAGSKRLRHRVARGLCDRGILRAEDASVLIVFKRRVYPQVDPRPERAVVERVRRAVCTDVSDLDERTVVLVSLAHHSGLLRHHVERAVLRQRKERLERLVAGDIAGGATRRAIGAAQAAAVVASTAAVSVVASSGHH